MEELFDCFQALQKDEEVRVVILTGSGEKAFVAGADINELARANPRGGKGNLPVWTAGVQLDRKPWQTGDRGDQRFRAGRRLRIGHGVHPAHCRGNRSPGTAGSQAWAHPGLWRIAAAAAPGGKVPGAGVDS